MASRSGPTGRRSRNANKTPYHERVAAEVIRQLEAGTAPWVKPWAAGAAPGVPVNAKTGKPYRGANQMWLAMLQGDSADPRWCTYKQAQELGAQVKKGARSATVQFWKFEETRTERSESGEERRVRIRLERPRCFFANVFHARDIEGLPEYAPPAAAAFEGNEAAERFLRASGARIFHDQGDRAFYRPATDSIHLPPKSYFHDAGGYYESALHELTHWSAHPSRLDRELVGFMGDKEAYAREELIAEIGSYMLATELGIPHNPGSHAAYIGSWIKRLKEDPHEIFRASREAQKALDFILDFDPQLRAERECEAQASPAAPGGNEASPASRHGASPEPAF
jgi:antirestriction protein ArdC